MFWSRIQHVLLHRHRRRRQAVAVMTARVLGKALDDGRIGRLRWARGERRGTGNRISCVGPTVTPNET
jgi:hypothetical protein